jgi:colanic acid biosynthesis glycosyl transferase WcaI
MMRILMLGINYWPEETGIAVFNTGRCEYLAARGHDVTMCTGFPYYPQWRVDDRYRGRLFARETRNGVRILRSYLYVPRRVTTLRRIVHEASFVASSCIRALGGRRPDILITESPPLALALSSVLLSRFWGVPYVFHVSDLQPDAAVDLGMLSNGRVTRVLYGLERLAYRRAGLVATLTPAMRARILTKGIAPEQVTVFPDWTEPDLFDLPLEGGGTVARERLGLDGAFLVVHAGNMGVKQGLDVVLGAAERSRDHRDLLYLLVGDGAVRGSLEDRARKQKLDNVRFVPILPTPMFYELLSTSDVTLVTQQRVVADILFPSKVRTMMAAGRPVVASLNASSEVARVVTDAGAGVVIPPEDPGALLDAILELRDGRGRRREMGVQGRLYARAHWNPEAILPEMERELLRVAGRHMSPPTPGLRDEPVEHSRIGSHAR